MTKEELEKEAEELIQRFEMANSMNCFMQLTPDRKQMGEMLVMIAEPREKRIADLEKELRDKKCNNKDCPVFIKLVQANKENTELKKQQFSLRNERNTFLAQNEQYEKDLIDFNENLTKAKEIIKKLKALYLYPVITKDDVKRQDEILAEAEQFLKEVSE